MKHKTLKTCGVALLGFGYIPLQAQTVATATGGNGTGSGGTVSYSVGQTVITTNKGVNGSVAQGVQQPYEISVIAGLENTESITLEYSVFPNPAADYLKLKITDYKFENLSYQLYDTNGKQIINQRISEPESMVSLNGLQKGSYFLKLTDHTTSIKTFKIVKQ